MTSAFERLPSVLSTVAPTMFTTGPMVTTKRSAKRTFSMGQTSTGPTLLSDLGSMSVVPPSVPMTTLVVKLISSVFKKLVEISRVRVLVLTVAARQFNAKFRPVT